MKISLVTCIVVSFIPMLVLAQNSVTITQKGHGNSATIIQNGDMDKAGDCLKWLAVLKNKNVLVIKNPGERDTLFTAKGKQFYQLSEVLNSKTKFEAFQKGLENRLYVLLPDTQSALSYLESTQRGAENKAVLQLNKSSTDVRLSQKGSGNTFVLNPCRGKANDKE